MLDIGEVFAGFTIERMLGQGGMGTVYLARHPRLDRLTALKLLNRDLFADERVRARFEREADLAAGLDHPGIVTVFDRGTEGEQLWISMQYVDGIDAATVDPMTLPPERAVQIIEGVADALDYAHGRGVLHRDVKPANILLARSSGGQGERVFLTDFGIARLRADSTHLTQQGMFTATLAYASPEQMTGAELDHRSDQYSLACALYWLLTGVAPFDSPDPNEIIRGTLYLNPPPLALRRQGLPPALDAVLAAAMAKYPAARFDSCAAFAKAARQALTSNTPPSLPRPPANTPTFYPPAPAGPYPPQTPGYGPTPAQPIPPAPHPAWRPPHQPPAPAGPRAPAPPPAGYAAPHPGPAAQPPAAQPGVQPPVAQQAPVAQQSVHPPVVQQPAAQPAVHPPVAHQSPGAGQVPAAQSPVAQQSPGAEQAAAAQLSVAQPSPGAQPSAVQQPPVAQQSSQSSAVQQPPAAQHGVQPPGADQAAVRPHLPVAAPPVAPQMPSAQPGTQVPVVPPVPNPVAAQPPSSHPPSGPVPGVSPAPGTQSAEPPAGQPHGADLSGAQSPSVVGSPGGTQFEGDRARTGDEGGSRQVGESADGVSAAVSGVVAGAAAQLSWNSATGAGIVEGGERSSSEKNRRAEGSASTGGPADTDSVVTDVVPMPDTGQLEAANANALTEVTPVARSANSASLIHESDSARVDSAAAAGAGSESVDGQSAGGATGSTRAADHPVEPEKGRGAAIDPNLGHGGSPQQGGERRVATGHSAPAGDERGTAVESDLGPEGSPQHGVAPDGRAPQAGSELPVSTGDEPDAAPGAGESPHLGVAIGDERGPVGGPDAGQGSARDGDVPRYSDIQAGLAAGAGATYGSPAGQGGAQHQVVPPEDGLPQYSGGPDVPPQPGAVPSASPQAGAVPSGSAQAGGVPSGSAQPGGVPGASPQAGAVPGGSPQAGGVPSGSAQAGGVPGGPMGPPPVGHGPWVGPRRPVRRRMSRVHRLGWLLLAALVFALVGLLVALVVVVLPDGDEDVDAAGGTAKGPSSSAAAVVGDAFVASRRVFPTLVPQGAVAEGDGYRGAQCVAVRGVSELQWKEPALQWNPISAGWQCERTDNSAGSVSYLVLEYPTAAQARSVVEAMPAAVRYQGNKDGVPFSLRRWVVPDQASVRTQTAHQVVSFSDDSTRAKYVIAVSRRGSSGMAGAPRPTAQDEVIAWWEDVPL
ncbi:protein kinase [Nocardia sp. NPDC050718]|uniref:protein kinase domain-containing protein n=1 Tax=Nocardia sp. NPDC050718 TaxID=3155788 RepID=UPI0034077531